MSGNPGRSYLKKVENLQMLSNQTSEMNCYNVLAGIQQFKLTLMLLSLV